MCVLLVVRLSCVNPVRVVTYRLIRSFIDRTRGKIEHQSRRQMQGSNPVQLYNRRRSDRITAKWKPSVSLERVKNFKKPEVIEGNNVRKGAT
jgi:hypothetical protein